MNPGQMIRPNVNMKEMKVYILVDFSTPEVHRMDIKETENIDVYYTLPEN